MAYRGANIDWISNLPPEIIEKILTLLPIEQAVKTSILARSWRDKWTSIPELDFQGFHGGSGTALNTVKGIDKFLLVHQGPIRKFSVKASSLTLMRKVDQWMRLLPKQDINDLRVQFKSSTHKVPSCLFDCRNLTHLELLYCLLDVPPNFEGFPNLKTLKLTVNAADSNIERLIWKSPLLESLSLFSYNASNDTITLSAPKVKFLNLQGDFKDICLEDSPVLVDMCFRLYNDNTNCKLIKVLGRAPNLEKLTVGYLCELSRIRCNRGALSATFNYLKVTKLFVIFLGESEGIPLVLELLTGAPNLEKLVIQCREHSVPRKKVNSDFWQKEYTIGHCFMKLKEIQMDYIYCVAPEIQFAKFMLQSSPVLEKMEISTSAWSKVTVSRMLKKLSNLRQATRAVITFHHRADSL